MTATKLIFGVMPVVGIALLTSQVQAQQVQLSSATVDALGEGLEVTTEEVAKSNTAGSPNSRTLAGYSFTSMQFTSEDNEKSLSLALAFDLGTYKPERDNANKGDFFEVSRTKLGIVATVPIEKDAPISRLFAGDSLVSGSKLKLSLTRFSSSLGSGGPAWRMLGDAYTRCIVEHRGTLAATRNATETGARDALFSSLQERLFKATKAKDEPGAEAFDTVWRDVAESGEDGKKVAAACQPSSSNPRFPNHGALIETYGTEPDVFRSSYIRDNAKIHFLGLDASIGRDDKSFLDRTTFKLATDARTSWEVAAYAGFINGDGTFSVRGRGIYGQTFEDNGEVEICRTVSIPAGEECIKGPDGAPKRKRTGLASFEARKLVTVNGDTKIGLAPQITYKFDDKSVGVEVPIYLSPDKDGKLSGGLKAVWNSKGNEFGLGLFVGVPFSIHF